MRCPLICIIAFLSLGGILGCRSTGNLAIRNYAGQYAENPRTPSLLAVPFSENDSITHIYARWPYSDLVYRKNDRTKLSYASASLHFVVYPDFRATAIADSGTFLLLDSLHAGGGELCDFEFEIKTPRNQTSILSLTLTDRKSRAQFQSNFYIRKNIQGSSSFFKVSQEGSGLLYSPVMHTKDPVVISFADKAVKSLYVNLFREKFPLPAPPFVQGERPAFKYLPDSSFKVMLENGNSAPLKLNRQGFYFFSCDSTFHEGFTLFRYSPEFPKLVNAWQMLMPLRYITSDKEFDKLSKSRDIRGAVDSFWITTAGNTDRALLLIRDYYSRVQRANELFSSHMEGWQTDRGLIYIVHGVPNVVYRNDIQEEWIYGEEGNMRSLHFYFMKVENPFSTSDFVLLRDPTLKQAWYMAVERWRR